MHTTHSLNGPWSITPEGGRSAAIQVPSPWQSVVPDDGPDVATYAHAAELPEGFARDGARYWLRFEAVATDARVRAAARDLGRHVGDWLPFQFEVSPESIASGSLDLEVRVDRMRPAAPVWVDGHPIQGGHITKGFHDVLSMQHAGIWDDVTLVRTGALCPIPNGIVVRADGRTGEVSAGVMLEPNEGGARGTLKLRVRDGGGKVIAQAEGPIEAPRKREESDSPPAPAATARVESPALWSPESPAAYAVDVELVDASGEVSFAESRPIAFRVFELGGREGRRVLLNGSPLFISGILDWGHEPDHGAPTPSEEELRERFTALRARGINTVCICMWYPPEHYYRVALEVGMILWQEHPVWKPPMGDELLDEYKTQLKRCFRRDARYSAIGVLSATCEHEAFNPRLGAWWWDRAHEWMPDTILQVQTSFLHWADNERTDLYDEHTYENSGRWVPYLEELDHALDALPPKPFAMGESVLYSSVPDPNSVEREIKRRGTTWWAPKVRGHLHDLLHELDARYGPGAGARFTRQVDAYHLRGRRFQTERVRAQPHRIGLVHNHIRDVPICPCGLMDDAGKWRFTPEEVRALLDPAVFLLETSEHRVAHVGGETITLRVGVSNFSREVRGGRIEIEITLEGHVWQKQEIKSSTEPGEVSFAAVGLTLPEVERPTALTVRAQGEGIAPNSWRLWVLPKEGAPPEGACVLAGHAHTEIESSLDFEEKRYSSGWGLANSVWTPRQPVPTEVLPDAPTWDGKGAPPEGARVVLTHRLLPSVVDWVERGGRALVLVSKATPVMRPTTVNLWGHAPLVLPAGPFHDTDADWLLEVLDFDLTRRWQRAVPSDELGWADSLEPAIRLVHLHDRAEAIGRRDLLAFARCGGGVIGIASLDVGEPSARFVVRQSLDWLASGSLPRGAIDPAQLRETAKKRD